MLKITTQTDGRATIIELEGRLAGAWVQVLEDSWKRTLNREGSVRLMVCGVTFIDERGKVLLVQMHRQGVELVAEGCMNTAIVEQIRRAGPQ